jgi:hypothetical protein
MHTNIDYIFQQAFEHSLQANIISIVGSAGSSEQTELPAGFWVIQKRIY